MRIAWVNPSPATANSIAIYAVPFAAETRITRVVLTAPARLPSHATGGHSGAVLPLSYPFDPLKPAIAPSSFLSFHPIVPLVVIATAKLPLLSLAFIFHTLLFHLPNECGHTGRYRSNTTFKMLKQLVASGGMSLYKRGAEDGNAIHLPSWAWGVLFLNFVIFIPITLYVSPI